MQYDLNDVHEELCTFEQWLKQYNPVKLELNKTYLQGKKGEWDSHEIKIVSIYDNIAVGMVVKDKYGNLSKGRYSLYYVDNGFKYNDYARPYYRLKESI